MSASKNRLNKKIGAIELTTEPTTELVVKSFPVMHHTVSSIMVISFDVGALLYHEDLHEHCAPLVNPTMTCTMNPYHEATTKPV